jgi:hypothetical protein
MATDPKRENEREYQPDPLLKEGRRNRTWVWTVGAVMLATIIGTLFAVGHRSKQQAATPPGQHATRLTSSSSNKSSHIALPAGPQNSSSPKEGDYHTAR